MCLPLGVQSLLVFCAINFHLVFDSIHISKVLYSHFELLFSGGPLRLPMVLRNLSSDLKEGSGKPKEKTTTAKNDFTYSFCAQKSEILFLSSKKIKEEATTIK